MTNKDNVTFKPEHVGLTRHDLYYLVIFRELNSHSQHPGAIYQTIINEIENPLLQARATFYSAVTKMENQGWIDYMEDGHKKIYSITAEGKKEIEQYQEKYLVPFEQVKTLSGLLIRKLTGDLVSKNISETSYKAIKLFNRLINVKEVTISIVLDILEKHPNEYGELTAKEIYNIMRELYGWSCSNGYLYETVHAMEEAGWIDGRWVGKRRNNYYYLITRTGIDYLPKASEDALFHLKKCRNFINEMIVLFENKN